MEESLAYRNIRYANAERFAAAELVPFHEAVEGAARGPVPPQNPSRFDVLLGEPAPLRQSEECQVLSVFTPGLSGRRPVMVWFHGGASITGGGELPWYDGATLAAEQDVVVVSVTARLGALGFLVLDGESAPSPATTDHLAAIEWIRRHIDQFGGDPENITLFGQSAGGWAIHAMLRWGVGEGVSGAIIQSGFLSQSDIQYGHEDVVDQARAFRTLVGRDPRSLSTPELLAAQSAYAKQLGRVEIWAPVQPDEPAPVKVPVIAGWTRHDCLPFVLLRHGIEAPTRGDIDAFDEQTRLRNYEDVLAGNYRLLDEVVRNGSRAWHYEFDWEVESSGWGSPHCMELPFLLGSQAAWQAAPMLKGADWSLIDERGRRLRAAWASFAREQNPGRDWEQWNSATRPATRVQNLMRDATTRSAVTAG